MFPEITERMLTVFRVNLEFRPAGKPVIGSILSK
jgi:hypothetical protein